MSVMFIAAVVEVYERGGGGGEGHPLSPSKRRLRTSPLSLAFFVGLFGGTPEGLGD